jgi:hypothetical protein
MDAPTAYLISTLIVFLTQLTIIFQGRKRGKKLDELHVIMNSRLDQLLSSSKSEARLEGHAAGVKEERQEKQ